MANDANIYLHGAGSADYINPTYWDKQIEQAARNKSVMLQFGVMNDTLKNKDGKQINIAKNQVFAAAALTDGTSTPITTLAYDQVTVTVGEVGLAKQVSVLELDYAFESVTNDIMNNMGLAIGTKIDTDIITALVSGAGISYYASGNAHDSTTVVNTDVLLFTDILGVRRLMLEHNFEPKAIIVSPKTESEVRVLKDPGDHYIFSDASVYGSATLGSSAIGKILGMTIYVSNNLPTATENTTTPITVSKSLVLGERPFVFAWKRMPKVEMDRGLITDRSVTFQATATYGVSVLNTYSVAKITSY